MLKRKFALLLLSLVVFTSGCSTTNKANESTQESTKHSSITNSATPKSSTVTDDTAVTDPYGNPIFDVDDKTNFPLYAALPSDNIYLYGIKPFGMVLYQDGDGTYFDWPGLTPRLILPEMFYYDYNGDGKKELAVTIYWGSGSEFAQMDLHILNIIPTEYNYKYTDNTLSASDACKWFDKSINAVPAKDKKTINVNFDGQNYPVKFPTDDTDSGAYKGISYGDIVYYKFSGNKIIVDIDIGFAFSEWVTPQYFGTIEATVNFNNNEFTLDDYKFIVDDLYK